MDLNTSESKKKKSLMWTFFDRPEIGGKVICKTCMIELKYSNNTSNMKDHLRRKHPEVLITSPSSSSENVEISMETQQPAKYAANSTRKKMLDMKFVKMVAVDMQPLRLAEHEGIKEFVEALDSKYEMPGRTTLSTKLLPKLYLEMKIKLFDILKNVKYLSVTTDAWTSTSNEGVLAVTAHFIIKTKLESALLAAVVLQGHHDADNISSVITSILEDWQCRNKVVAMVTDNASTMTKAAEILKLRHMPCFAHSLNLVIKHTLQEPECDAIRDLIEKSKAIVSFFKHSTLASDQLKSIQKDLKKTQLKPIQNVETRWNSAYQMLKRIGEIRDELTLTLNKNPKAPRNLTEEEYHFLAEIVKVFEPIDECTQAVSGETYVTLSLIIPLIKGLLLRFAQLDKEPLLESTKTVIETLKKYIQMKIKPYELRNPCIISTLLNPHFKKQGFKTESEVERAVNVVQKEYTSYLFAQNKNTSPASDLAQPGTSEEVTVPPKKPKLNILSYLQEFQSTISSNATADAIVDINHYLSKPIIDTAECPIEYWCFSISGLKNIALKYMTIPATSTPAERIFSMAGQIIVERRNRLSGDHLNELLFIKQNHTLLEK